MTYSAMSRSASAPSLQAALLQAPEREASSWITSPPMLPIPHAHSASSAQAARASLQMGLLGGFPLSPRMGCCGAAAATAPSCHASCSDPSPRFTLRHSVPASHFFGASVPDSRPGPAMGAGMRRVFSDNMLRGTTTPGESTPRMCRVTSSHDLHGSAGAGWEASKDDSSQQGDAPFMLPSTLLNAGLQGFTGDGAPLGVPSTCGMSSSDGRQEADAEAASPSSNGNGASSSSGNTGSSLNSLNSLRSLTGMGQGKIRRSGSVPSAGSAPWTFLQGIGEGDGEEEEEEAAEGMEDALIVGIAESAREGPVLWLDDWRKGSLRPLAPQEELAYRDTSREAFCDMSYTGPSRGLPKTPQQEARVGTEDSTEATEEYYERALQGDPDNGLILRNFSRFLVQTKGDYITAERCLEKAVAVCPRDADVLVQYAKLLWDFRHDAEGATTFFERAVQSAPDDCYVLAAYASFLWSVDATSNAAAAAEAVASKPSCPTSLLTPATT